MVLYTFRKCLVYSNSISKSLIYFHKMAEKWDERYKIAENEPVGVLSECAIAELGILMEDDYQEAASLLGMDEYLPYIRTCSEKGSKLLRLWSSVRGNQANFRIMKTLFSQRHRAIVDKLDDLMWCEYLKLMTMMIMITMPMLVLLLFFRRNFIWIFHFF